MEVKRGRANCSSRYRYISRISCDISSRFFLTLPSLSLPPHFIIPSLRVGNIEAVSFFVSISFLFLPFSLSSHDEIKIFPDVYIYIYIYPLLDSIPLLEAEKCKWPISRAKKNLYLFVRFNPCVWPCTHFRCAFPVQA